MEGILTNGAIFGRTTKNLDEPKVEKLSDLPQKSSPKLVNLRKNSRKCSETFVWPTTLGKSSETFVPEIAEKTKKCSKGKKSLEI